MILVVLLALRSDIAWLVLMISICWTSMTPDMLPACLSVLWVSGSMILLVSAATRIVRNVMVPLSTNA